MRIISGKNRGRILIPPKDGRIRPTSDRVKENIFNILSNDLDISGITVLDLFCGSGALGLEAVSRGAGQVIFVDNDRESIELCKRNAALISAQNCRFMQTDYCSALRTLGGTDIGLIFSDSPYGMDMNEIFSAIERSGLLERAVLVMEHSSENHLLIAGDNYIIDERRYGGTCVTVVKRGRNQ